MSMVRTSSRFQIAIPKQIRDRLGIHAGQRFLVTDKDGTIILTPVPANLIDYLCGTIKYEPSLSAGLRMERDRDRGRGSI